MTPPTLETARLTLRPPQPRHAEGFIAFMAGERARCVGGPVAPGRGWRAFASLVGHWALRGRGSWVAERRADRCAVATVGGWEPGDWPEPELGWSVWREEDEGRGDARETAEAARAALFRLGVRSLVGYVDPKNTRSCALAERLGARLDPQAPFPGDGPCLVFRHPRPEAA